ncbi:DUF3231 family protein [Bacillus fonticola]|uniref:DUF3231 family protein n=1 Tax=Bacillus fonticola TaxID=2728853 RepID=UPI00147429F6|nr:DUF3231 family protein [Bacillus fonticola]
MENKEQVKLTASELAALWSAYINDTMSLCFVQYFKEKNKDPQIAPAIEKAYHMSTTHLQKLRELYEKEELPLPIGFGKEDVNVDAEQLYSDMFALTFVENMAKVGMVTYSAATGVSTRKDVRHYFMGGLQESAELFDLSSEIGLKTGLFVRAPFIPYPTQVDFVDKKSYLSGYSMFNKQRPLNAIEISHLYMNIQTNLMGSRIALSFAQASPTKEVQDFMLRGKDISEKHIKIFSDVMLENGIQPPISSDISITNSTVPPFSDKLMVFFMSLLSTAGVGNYAAAASASQRSDLVVNYERLSLEIGKYAKTGADLMIQNGYLEEPPGTVDKEKLVQTKKE